MKNDACHSRKWYRKTRAAGFCIRCGRNPADNGYVSCIGCRARRKERTEGVWEDRRYLAWIASQACTLHRRRDVPCAGRVEAHHAGRRPGIAMKALDATAIPLCQRHHRDYHEFTGPFLQSTSVGRQLWADFVIEQMRGRYLSEHEVKF